MKFVRYFAIAALLAPSALWLAACGPGPAGSLQGLFADKDCEAMPELLGDWTGSDLDGVLTLQKLGDRKYRLLEQVEESNQENRAAFDICVAHLGGHLFFDATYQEVRPDGKEVLSGDAKGFWTPAHLIGRLDVEKNALHFRLLDDDWLQDALKSGRVHLTTTRSDDEKGYVVVGPGKELKEFATRFANDPKAFSYEMNFERAPKKEDAKKD